MYDVKRLDEDNTIQISGKELSEKGLFINSNGKLNTSVYYLKETPVN